MEGERRGGWAYRHADAYVHELADGTHTPRFRPYYITFYWLSSPWREQKERCERKGDEARSEKKKLASLHRESALIKAPFYTFRWHQGITSVSRYFFFFPPPPPSFFHSLPFSSLLLAFFCFAFFFFFLSFISLFFFLFCFHGTSDTRDMKLRESERGREEPLSFETTLFALDCFERILGFGRIGDIECGKKFNYYGKCYR